MDKFAAGHNISKRTLETLISEIKESIVDGDGKKEKVGQKNTCVQSAMRRAVPFEVERSLKAMAKNCGFDICEDDLTPMKLSNTHAQLLCASWLKNHFSLCADTVPNNRGIVHIEKKGKNQMFNLYKQVIRFMRPFFPLFLCCRNFII